MVELSGLGIGIELLRNIMVNTTFTGSFLILQLTVLTATLIIISRNFEDWKQLALPVIVGWHTAGFSFQWVFFFASALTFVVSLLSLEVIGNAIGAVGGQISGAIGRTTDIGRKLTPYEKAIRKEERVTKLQRRQNIAKMDVKKEIKKLKRVKELKLAGSISKKEREKEFKKDVKEYKKFLKRKTKLKEE